MLLLTEWPRLVDMELPVSDEMVESGLGMYSTFSENSTRGLDGGRVGDSGRGTGSDSSVSSSAVEVCGACPGCSTGVLGRLLLNLGCGSAGDMRKLKSCPEMAVDLRCLCPPFGVMGIAVDFVGLELMALRAPTPPTNSLTFLLCPPRGVASRESFCPDWSSCSACRPEVSVALKLKLGSAETPRVCLLSAVRGRELALLVWNDIGRRCEADGEAEGVEDGSVACVPGVRIGNTNCGFEIMLICGACVAIGTAVIVSEYCGRRDMTTSAMMVTWTGR